MNTNENSGTQQTCIRNIHAGKLSLINETENIFSYETKKSSFIVYNPPLFTKVRDPVRDQVLLCIRAAKFLRTICRVTRGTSVRDVLSCCFFMSCGGSTKESGINSIASFTQCQ